MPAKKPLDLKSDIDRGPVEKILEELRQKLHPKCADSIEQALITEASKQTKAIDRKQISWKVAKEISAAVARVIDGKDHALPVKFLHLQPIVTSAAVALSGKRLEKVKVPAPSPPRDEIPPKEKRGKGRIGKCEEILNGLTMFVQQDRYSLLLTHDRGQIAVTLLGEKMQNATTVIASDVIGALDDALGKMTRLA